MGPERGSRNITTMLTVSVIAMIGGLAIITESIGAAAIPIYGMTMVAATIVLRGPVGKAIARQLGGEAPEGGQLLEVPQEVYAELDELRARVLELEERQDFTDRLLADKSRAADGA